MTRISSKVLLMAAMGIALWGCQTPPQPANQASALAPTPLPEARARYVVFFTPWSSRLDSGGHAVVASAAHRIVKDGHVRVTVIGYTDPNGRAEDNKKLSAERAQTVADALASGGVDRSLIEVRSMGSVGYVAEPLEARRAVITIDNP
ncbi:MAG TPA: OmpA family protein [Rhizomicrobium sp.]|nr:OmpA family protein [Rhizomicrobium sp.]